MYSEFRDPFMVRIQSERSAEAQTQRRTNSDMKTPILSAVRRPERIVNRMLNGAGLCVFAAWLLFSVTPAQSAPTRQELIDYAKTTWELTDLTDNVISQTLDTSYSGIPYKDYVSYFTVAPSILNPLLSGDYKTAGTKAADFWRDESISYLLKQAGLSGVFAPARLAAWPIEQGLNSFQNAVKEASFKNQILLYFAARSAGNSYSEIVALEEFRLLAADPDILKNNRDLVMKIRYADGQLWLAYSTSYLVGSVPGYTPAQFYDYAEQQWQSLVATKSYAAHQAIIKDAFRAAAAPQKPVITQQPQDAVIASGQSAALTVAATGATPFQYVWELDGVPYAGPYGATFNATVAGQYRVTVYDANTLFTKSRSATVTVNAGEPVAITAPAANANVSGSITVRGSVSGATKVEFYLDAVRQFTDSSTPFAWTWNTAIAANGAHALTAKAYNGVALLGTSAAVNVTVNNAAPPTCTDSNEPNDSSPTATPLSFGVTANGYVCTATDVDWFKVEVATPGVLTFDLTVPAANDYDIELFGPDYAYIKGSYRDTGLAENITHDATSTGTYFVRVYGYPIGNGSHNAAVPYALTAGVVSGPVAILTPPQNRSVPVGASASFSVVASGAPPLAYQWQRNGVDIPGATGPTYATPVLTLADSGAQFRVRVTNAFGSVLSAPATLTVNTANVITWTGAAGDGNWFNRTNWNPRTVPTASDVVNINTAIIAPATAEFALMNLNGSLSGSFSLKGTLNWTGGVMNARLTVAAGGVLNIAGGAWMLGGSIDNAGTVVWTANQTLFGSTTSAITNQAGGLFEIRNDQDINCTGCSGFSGSFSYSGGLPAFVNLGLLRKSSGNGTNSLYISSFQNTGLVDVQSGAMTIPGGFTSIGTFTGAGTALLSGPVYGTLNGHNFVLNAGSLSGAFTLNGTLNWTGGVMNARLIVAAGGVLNIAGGAWMLGGSIVNAGTVVWSANRGLFGSTTSAITNEASGVFEIRNDQDINCTGCSGSSGSFSYSGSLPAFINAGTLLKSAGARTNSLYISNVLNTGRVEVRSGTLAFGNPFTQTLGETRLAGGSLSGGTFNFTGGTLSGTGTINGTVVNGAVVSPGSSPGTLTINGNYTQTAAGVLQMELGGLTPGSGFDRLVVNGQATLAGALNVTLINSFTPGFGDAFSVLSYNSRSGNFASINLPALPNSLALTAQYSSTNLTLLTVNGGGNNQTNAFQMTRASNGLPELRFTGQPNHTYRLQASTNLVDWLDISTNTPVNGLLRFVDPAAVSIDHRFYRAVSP